MPGSPAATRRPLPPLTSLDSQIRRRLTNLDCQYLALSRAMPAPAVALSRIRKLFQPLRQKSVSKRHLHLRQALRVHHIAFTDDLVAKEQIRGEGVNLIVRQGAL